MFVGSQSPWSRQAEARQNERLRGLSATVSTDYSQVQVHNTHHVVNYFVCEYALMFVVFSAPTLSITIESC